MFDLQSHSVSADGPSHFMNEQMTHGNLCLKCDMPIALLQKGLWLMPFCFNWASRAPLSCLLFFPVCHFHNDTFTRMS